MPLELVTVPCLSDNYAYILHDADSGATAVADVPDAMAVEAALKNLGWTLSHILVTHHHDDHIGGVDALRAATGAKVVGNAADASRLPRLDISVSPGDRLEFGTDTLEILDVSGHTIGHIAYFFGNAHVLLSGDSLMALGCGRLFEGTPAQMHASLTRMAALPDDTKICSGHEYTQANARFAQSVDPDNAALKARAEKVNLLRKDGHPTVPTTLAEEKATNPFLRTDDPAIRRLLGMESATNTEVFAEIRARKDRF